MIDKTKIADLIAKAVRADSSLEALQYSQAACNAANAACAASSIDDQPGMSDAQIKHMVDRFLAWKLPEDFSPDNGISATRPNYGAGVLWEPAGTNLLNATQAEEMIRHIADGIPA